MFEKKICPKCGERSMAQNKLPGGKYVLICERCGTKRGEFHEDMKRGVV